MKAALLTATLLTAFLSGCASDGAAPSAADEPAAPAASASPRPDTPPAATAPAAGVERQTAFEKDGVTATGACAYAMGTGQCAFPYSDSFLLLDFPGAAQRVQGTLTWTSAAGTAPILSVYLLSEEGGSWSFDEDYASDYSGAGEIAFDWDVSRLAGRGLAVQVSTYTGTGAAVGYAGAAHSMPFTVSGTVTSLV